MRTLANLWKSMRGSAAAELAMTVPVLLILALGTVEMGLYFWSEHILLNGVRDGAVFASRQSISNFDCPSSTVDAGVVTTTKQVTRAGAPVGGTDRLDHWADEDTEFTVTLACVTSINGTTLSGIYSANDGLVPVITVYASVPYKPLVAGLGFPLTAQLQAMEQATVVGV